MALGGCDGEGISGRLAKSFEWVSQMEPHADERFNCTGQGLVLIYGSCNPTALIAEHSLSTAHVWSWAKSARIQKFYQAPGLRNFTPVGKRDHAAEHFAMAQGRSQT